MTGGIRPEHVRICSEEETAFKGNVSVFELLGSNAIIYVQCGEERIVINTDETAQQEHGKELFLNVKEEKLHIFDPESERTITN